MLMLAELQWDKVSIMAIAVPALTGKAQVIGLALSSDTFEQTWRQPFSAFQQKQISELPC